MLFASELALFLISVISAFASLDPPMQPLIGESKAFIMAPYVNTVKIQKVLTHSFEDDVSLRWPNGIVRYYVDKRSYDDIFQKYMIWPMHIIERSSCIEFMGMKEKPSVNTTWIHITNPRKERECNHKPRFEGTGEIELVFGYDCLKRQEILHTLLHGIGIKDEVTHPHRDKYIRVLWDNIHPAYQHLYRKQAEISSKTLTEYDPLSVMHFHDRAFSRNGRATIAALEPGLLISPSDTLSQLDKMRLQMYFGHECNKRKVSNLLKTCKKSLGGAGGGQAGEKEGQNADSDDAEIGNGTENYTATTDNGTDLNQLEQTIDVENEGGLENAEEISTAEEEVNNIKEQDVKELEGQVTEGQSIEGSDADEGELENAEPKGRVEEKVNYIKEQGVKEPEGQVAEDQYANRQSAEGKNINENGNGQGEDGSVGKGEYFKKEDDGENTNHKNTIEEIDENEEVLKGTNMDAEKSDEMKSKNKQLTADSAYENDSTERISGEKNLKFALKREISDANAEQLSDSESELNDRDNEVFRR